MYLAVRCTFTISLNYLGSKKQNCKLLRLQDLQKKIFADFRILYFALTTDQRYALCKKCACELII